MDQEYCIVKAYREDTDLRRSFNRLAGEIFGLDFEDWYQGLLGRQLYSLFGCDWRRGGG